MKNICNYIVSNFGFIDIADFVSSMIHSKLLFLTIPSSVFIFTLIEQWLGVTSAIFTSFLVGATMELITGLWAARVKGQKWSSHKFSRFGLKILVWLSLIFVVNSWKVSYADVQGLQGWIIFQLFTWFHGVLTVYVALEYIISVLENYSAITGKSTSKLTNFLKRKFDQLLGAADAATTPAILDEDAPTDEEDAEEDEVVEEDF